MCLAYGRVGYSQISHTMQTFCKQSRTLPVRLLSTIRLYAIFYFNYV